MELKASGDSVVAESLQTRREGSTVYIFRISVPVSYSQKAVAAESRSEYCCKLPVVEHESIHPEPSATQQRNTT